MGSDALFYTLRTFRRAIAVLVVVALAGNLAADNGIQTDSAQTVSGTTIREQVSQIQPGTSISIRFTDGAKARGYLTQVDTDGFSFRTGNATTGNERRTAFNAVKSVKVERPTHTHPIAWIAAGAIVAVVVAVLIAFLIQRHNEGG